VYKPKHKAEEERNSTGLKIKKLSCKR